MDQASGYDGARFPDKVLAQPSTHLATLGSRQSRLLVPISQRVWRRLWAGKMTPDPCSAAPSPVKGEHAPTLPGPSLRSSSPWFLT